MKTIQDQAVPTVPVFRKDETRPWLLGLRHERVCSFALSSLFNAYCHTFPSLREVRMNLEFSKLQSHQHTNKRWTHEHAHKHTYIYIYTYRHICTKESLCEPLRFHGNTTRPCLYYCFLESWFWLSLRWSWLRDHWGWRRLHICICWLWSKVAFASDQKSFWGLHDVWSWYSPFSCSFYAEHVNLQKVNVWPEFNFIFQRKGWQFQLPHCCFFQLL